METSVVMHFYNESLLIGDWIDHHRLMFDHGVLIDHHSTDGSREIAASKLPPGWEIVTSRLPEFDAWQNDCEVMWHERRLPGWKVALNVTEYLFCPDLRGRLAEWSGRFPHADAFCTRPACLVDKEPLPLERPLWRNRTHGFLNYEPGTPLIRYWRFMHRGGDGKYGCGRHDTGLARQEIPDFLHVHFTFSPWPECLARKLQIQTRMPESDKANGLGRHHLIDRAGLEARRREYLAFSGELRDIPLFGKCYDALLGDLR